MGKLSRFSTQNLFQICACVISARKAKHLDATTMFTYSHANTPLGQSQRAYYLSYFIKSTPIYPRTLLHIPSTALYRPCTLIYPYGSLHIPLLPFFSPLIIPLMNLQDNGLGSSLAKSPRKRSYHQSHSKKLSIKDLALELAKKHVSSIILKT